MAMVALMLGQAFLLVGTLWASRAVVNAAASTFGLAAPTTGGSAGLPLSAVAKSALRGWSGKPFRYSSIVNPYRQSL